VEEPLSQAPPRVPAAYMPAGRICSRGNRPRSAGLPRSDQRRFPR